MLNNVEPSIIFKTFNIESMQIFAKRYREFVIPFNYWRKL